MQEALHPPPMKPFDDLMEEVSISGAVAVAVLVIKGITMPPLT